MKFSYIWLGGSALLIINMVINLCFVNIPAAFNAFCAAIGYFKVGELYVKFIDD